eukprot:846210-Amphidinium_carterae.2
MEWSDASKLLASIKPSTMSATRRLKRRDALKHSHCVQLQALGFSRSLCYYPDDNNTNTNKRNKELCQNKCPQTTASSIIFLVLWSTSPPFSCWHGSNNAPACPEADYTWSKTAPSSAITIARDLED